MSAVEAEGTTTGKRPEGLYFYGVDTGPTGAAYEGRSTSSPPTGDLAALTDAAAIGVRPHSAHATFGWWGRRDSNPHGLAANGF